MRRMLATALAAMMVLSAVGFAPAAGAKPAPRSRVRLHSAAVKKAQTGRVTVGYTSATSAAALAAATAKGGKLARSPQASKTIVVTPPAGVSADQFAAELSKTRGVAYAEPEVRMQALWVPNDTYFKLDKYQWGISKTYGINMPDAWEYTKGDPSVVVAVVDSGVTSLHPDSPIHIDTDNDRDFIDKDNDASPEVGDGGFHGTFVAGIIAAATDNAGGMAGIAPDCTILPIRSLDENGNGTDVTVSDGIVWAADHGADIINLSVGGPSNTQVQEDAVNYARSKGCVVVAASGNSASLYPGELAYPAALPGVISVGAIGTYNSLGMFPSWMTSYTARSSFSQYGYGLDLAAPGSSILSIWYQRDLDVTQPPDGILDWYLTPENGTSFATPHVAGVAALVRTLHPAWTPDQVELALEQSALDLGSAGYDQYYGNGRVTASAALAVTTPTVPPSDDDIPGVPIPGSPIKGTVDWQSDLDDVYSIEASAGETIELTMYGPTPTSPTGPDIDLYLFGPNATSVESPTDLRAPNPPITDVTSNEKISYKVPLADDGKTFYADVYAYEEGGNYTLYWAKGIKTYASAMSGPGSVTLGNYVTLSGSLTDDTGSAPATGTVTIQVQPSGSSSWTTIGSGMSNATGTYSIKFKPTRTAKYRAVYSAAGYLNAYSATKTITAYSYLTKPSGPSKVKKGSRFTSTGWMRPRHALGSKTVKLYCYHRESGNWKLRKTVDATNVYITSASTKYKARYYLPKTGKWKVVAKVKADTYHAATASAARYITVY